MRSVQWQRTLPRYGSPRILTTLAWVLASLLTALLAHACIGIVGDLGAGGEAYGEHEHAAVAPVACGALGVVIALVFRSAACRIGRARAIDPALLLAGRFGTMHPTGPSLAVAAGGASVLFAMEAVEGYAADGQFTSIVDALGGNAYVGFAIVVAVAFAITLLGLRSARTLLASAVATVDALHAWVVAKTPVLVHGATVLARAHYPRRSATNALRARCRGLRAPPLALA
jgi:hypothetical protein